MAIDKELAHHWCEELAANVSAFRKKSRMKPEAKLYFISKQYASLFALVRINRGDAIMKGFPHRSLPQELDNATDELSE